MSSPLHSDPQANTPPPPAPPRAALKAKSPASVVHTLASAAQSHPVPVQDRAQTVAPPTETELVQLLLDCAFLALSRGLQTFGRELFDRLHIIRPSSEVPLIGLAFAELLRQKPNDAIRILREEALAVAPQSEIAHAFLALAQQQAGLASAASETLDSLLTHGKDPAALALARSLKG